MTTPHPDSLDLTQLREDLAKVRQDLKEVASGAVRLGKDQAIHMKELASEGLASVKEFAEERPLATLAVAFGAGVLAGVLLGRCRR